MFHDILSGMETIQDIRARVDAYLTARNIKASAFGREHFKDPNFVDDLRQGRDLKSKTVDKLLAIMDAE